MPDGSVAQLAVFSMPSLGADMDEGTIVEWLVAPGAAVKRGDIMAVVETDKSDLDVEAFTEGTIVELLVPAGTRVPVGTPLATLAPSGAAVEPVAAAPSVPAPPMVAGEKQPVPATAPPVARRESKARSPRVSSPVLRHLADKLHVDTAAVRGTGPGGRVTREDIERAAGRRRITPRARRLARQKAVDLQVLEGTGILTGDAVLAATSPVTATATPQQPSSRPADRFDAAKMRRTIGRLMTKSWREIPHYHVGSRIDVDPCLTRLEQMNADRPVAARVLPAAVFARAAAQAAAAVPEVNGFWIDERFVPAETVNLGIVVALRQGGLLAPVIHDAAEKDVDAVMKELRDLVTRARSGRLRASDVTGATFTITLLGEGGVERVSPIIHHPQVAILGLGAVQEEPWALNGMIGARRVVHADLAGDHRAIDGRIGSLFLTTLNRLLQEPNQ
jgi:pyruvate dehydrogenase E2 component (dihydrolipoyllysine-residue acetyltransferase)